MKQLTAEEEWNNSKQNLGSPNPKFDERSPNLKFHELVCDWDDKGTIRLFGDYLRRIDIDEERKVLFLDFWFWKRWLSKSLRQGFVLCDAIQ